jgi:hypothetical protein
MNMNNNNTTVCWITIIVPILIVLSSLGITFSTTNSKRITEHDKSLAVIETELKYMNKQQSLIDKKLDEVLDAVK